MEFNEQLEELGDIDQTEVDNGELEETAIQRIHSEKSEIGIDYDSGEDKLRSLSSDTQDLIQVLILCPLFLFTLSTSSFLA